MKGENNGERIEDDDGNLEAHWYTDELLLRWFVKQGHIWHTVVRPVSYEQLDSLTSIESIVLDVVASYFMLVGKYPVKIDRLSKNEKIAKLRNQLKQCIGGNLRVAHLDEQYDVIWTVSIANATRLFYKTYKEEVFDTVTWQEIMMDLLAQTVNVNLNDGA